MNKRSIRRFTREVRPLNPWYLFAAAVLCFVVSVGSLRHNNVVALQLRDQVLVADKDNGDTETALRNLREYVYAHMNTNLASGPNAIHPPIQLKYRYDRLAQAEKDQVSAQNSKIYTDAQKTCEQQFPTGLSGGGRVPCIQDYVSKHGITEQAIPESLYKFDFVSPFWSPDLAGWTLLAGAILLGLFVIRYILDFWLKAELED